MDEKMGAELPEPPTGKRGWPWNSVDGDGGPIDIEWPKITVVTPSYNQARFIEETIRSILLQRYPNLEFLIIDGGSSDRTVEIIRRYEPWITSWVSEKDDGQADAINKGFSASTGDLLCWLNSDDLFYPGHLHRMAAAFNDRPSLDFAFRDIGVGPEFGEESSIMEARLLSFAEMIRTLEVPIPQQASMWRRRAWERVGPLDARWQVVLDREYFLRLAERCTTDRIEGVGGFFRQHEDAKSTAELARWADELPRLYHEFFNRSDLPPEIARLRSETLATTFLTCAHIVHLEGRRGARLGFLARAFISDWRTVTRRLTGRLHRSTKA